MFPQTGESKEGGGEKGEKEDGETDAGAQITLSFLLYTAHVWKDLPTSVTLVRKCQDLQDFSRSC